MKTIALIIKLLILAVLLFFALKNTHVVPFYWASEHSVQYPLIVFLLIAFATGALLGVLAMFGREWRLRSKMRSMQRTHKKQEQATEKRLQEEIAQLENQISAENTHE